MPVTIKDSEGNDVEVLTQEDVDARVQERLDAVEKQNEENKNEENNNEKQVVEEKNKETNTETNTEEQPPAWFKAYADRLDTLAQNQSQSHLTNVTSNLDADKRKEVEDKFASLQGYDNTTSGQEQRANDAYLLTMGERFNAEGINMSNLSASGNAPAQQENKGKGYTDEDKAFQKSLGISEEDAEKYGNKNK